MNNWYVIQTKPRKEDEVSRRFDLARIETLNPKMKSFTAGYKPLFPNYIFIRWNFSDARNYHTIKYTRGVNKILGTPDYPVPVSDGVVQVIKGRLGSDNVLEQQIMGVGSRVKVKRGLLKDLIGVLERPVSADGRVAVLLRIYEREMKAMLHCRDIVPVLSA